MKTKNFYKIVKPTKEEGKKINELVHLIISKINIPKAVIFVGGSFAKGTWLKGLHDLDVYIKFDYTFYRDKDISTILKKELEKRFKKITVLKGSREYYQVNIGDYRIEIIPIVDIKSVKEARNITDISPLHVEWVKKHKGKEDEIRLAKAFCKSLGVYGAESYIKGFSGYVLEILTIHYGSFNNLVKAAAHWKQKIVVDHEGYYKGRNPLKELNEAKLHSPLILIDPVQKTRNAAAGLDWKCYETFVKAAKEFLKKPSEKFFIKKEFSINGLRKKAKGKVFVLIEVVPQEGREDIIGAKLLKCFGYIKMAIENEGFKLLESNWCWEKKPYFWYVLNNKKLSEIKKHYGPPLKYTQRLKSFKERWKGKKVYQTKGISYVEIKRDFRTANSFMVHFIKNDQHIKRLVLKLRVL